MPIVKYIVFVFIGMILIFLLWMNLTPGHCQLNPCRFVGYYSNSQVIVKPGAVYNCPMMIEGNIVSLVDNVKLFSATFDLYK